MAFAALASAASGLGSGLISSITSGVNNSNNIQNRLDLQRNSFGFQKEMLNLTNDARLHYLDNLASRYRAMGVPPALAYGGLNNLSGVQYKSGLNYSTLNQPGFNGAANLGYAIPNGF